MLVAVLGLASVFFIFEWLPVDITAIAKLTRPHLSASVAPH